MSNTTAGVALCYHALLHIVEFLSGDYGVLYNCALVNWQFNFIASRILYSRVKLSPPFRRVLDLKREVILSVRVIPV